MKAGTPTHLVALVGGSGAGKGWLVERLCRLFGSDATHLQLDDFYRDCSHLPMEEWAGINFDVPEAIDWEWTGRVLHACREGRTIAVPSYDFATHSRVLRTFAWTPRPVVFVDGLWLLHSAEIRRLFDLKIFLDTPTRVRCDRRLTRDVARRGYSREAIERQLRTAVVPMHDEFVEPQKAHADVVLPHPMTEEHAVALADRLWTLRSAAAATKFCDRDAFRANLLGMILDHEYCT